MSLRLPFLVLAGASLVTLAGCVVAANGGSLPDLISTPLAETSQAPAPPMSEVGLGEADGYVPVGVWLTLADDVPAITNLDADLRAALEAAAVAARDRGTELSFTDAWRSAAYQQHLFDDAVAKYGSEEEARRWVKPADESEHVHGRAVDIATADAMDFLSRFGAEFGLCQIYANEAWHYEYVPGVTNECPAPLPDSTAG